MKIVIKLNEIDGKIHYKAKYLNTPYETRFLFKNLKMWYNPDEKIWEDEASLTGCTKLQVEKYLRKEIYKNIPQKYEYELEVHNE